MGDLFSSADPSVTPPPEKINIAGPTGSATFGTFDEAGNFIPDPGIITQLTEESEFQQALRAEQERSQLGLAGQIGRDPLTQVRGTEGIREFVPRAKDLRAGLSEFQEAGVASGQFDPSGLQAIGGDFSADALRQEQATFQRASNLLSPEFDQQREDLEQALANKGIPVTSKAGERELNRLERSQGAQLENLALSSVGAGRGEQERLERLGIATRGQQFGEQATQAGVGIQEAGLAASQRGQELSERNLEFQNALQRQLAFANLEAQQRAQQIAETQGTGLLGTPFQPTPVTSLGAGSTGATPSGPGFEILGAAIGGAAGASDIRLKENIEPIGVENGHNIYEFEYSDKSYGKGRFRGVMAHEIEKINPNAVMTMSNGFKAVFYDMIGIKMEAV